MNLTTNQIVGQLMMIGWPATTADDIIEYIKRYNYGNIILFTRNIKSAQQITDVCGAIQQTAIKYNGIPCFIAIDQEGGSVRRIYREVTATPGNMALAAAESAMPKAARTSGQIIGKEIKNLGINFNLAPVSDINSNPFNPIIGIRSFSDNPEVVSRLSSAFATGLEESGVLGCYKHFIGHGDVDMDSHIDIPRVNKTLAQLTECELVPYCTFRQPEAIMSAHILYTALDDRFPATISKLILKNLLRDKLGYKGLIVSDCFEMDALIKTFSLEDAAVFSIKASCDIITVSHSIGRQQSIYDRIKREIESGGIDRDIVNASIKRILAAKSKYCKQTTSLIDVALHSHLSREISEASICLISGKPFAIDEDTVCVGVDNMLNNVAEDKNIEKAEVARSIGEAFNIKYLTVGTLNYNMNSVLALANGKKVILCLSDAHLTLTQKVLYTTLLQAGCRIMLVSMRTPYDSLNANAPECHIAAFEYTLLSIQSIITALKTGEFKGKCPVQLDSIKHEAPQTTDRTAYLTERILKYIQYNYSRKLTLKVVADEFLLSEGHVSKVIKKKTGKNFVELINEIRITEAKKLLNSTNFKVNEIASLVGYTDLNYFARIFKQISAVTPTFYRNNATKFEK